MINVVHERMSFMTGSTTDPDAPAPHRVLIAEDEALIRLDLAEMLREEGYEVVVRTPAPIAANSPLPARVGTVVGLLRARPEVKQVLDYANTGDSTMISRHGDLTVVVATVGNVNEKQMAY